VLALTLLFGRVYCSMICPLGTLQDIVIALPTNCASRAGSSSVIRNRMTRWRYGVLALTVGLFLSGSILAVTLLDPFSNFGRIAGDLLRPLYIAAHNGVGELLKAWALTGRFRCTGKRRH
jgi:polyferredoxin